RRNARPFSWSNPNHAKRPAHQPRRLQTSRMQDFMMTGIRKSLLLFLLLATPFAAEAQSTVYKCLDGDGRVTYTNNRNEGRSCTPLSRDLPVSTVSAPRARPATAASDSSASFPKVSPAAQKSRDDNRRTLL